MELGALFSLDKKADASVISAVVSRVFNTMGYAAVSPGPTDFGRENDPLKELAAELNCPLITSNIVYKKGGGHYGQKYAVHKAGNIRIGMIGVMPENAFSKMPVMKVPAGLKIIPPESAIKTLVPELLPQTDMIVLLSQCGYFETEKLAALDGIDYVLYSANQEYEEEFKRRRKTIGIHCLKNNETDLKYLQLTLAGDGNIQVQKKEIELHGGIAEDERIASIVEEEPARLEKQRRLEQAREVWRIPPLEYMEMMNEQHRREMEKRKDGNANG